MFEVPDAAFAAMALGWGTVLAAILVRSRAPGRGVVGAGLLAMLPLPLVLHAAGWQAALGVQGAGADPASHLAAPVHGPQPHRPGNVE